MLGYFGGVLVGRAVGSAFARRYEAARLLAFALALTAVGFVVLWPASSPLQAFLGLAVIGAGIGNLFPLGLSVAVALAPGRAVAASGRAVLMASTAVLLAPLTVATLADALSLRAAFLVVPVLLALAASGLAVVQLRRKREPRPGEPQAAPGIDGDAVR
jgi:fucose permease